MISRKSLGAIYLGLLSPLVLTAQPTVASQTYSGNEVYEIPLPEFSLQGPPISDGDPGITGAAQALASRYRDRWRVHSWKPQTRTPHFAYGLSVTLAAAVTSASDLQRLGRQVVAGNADLLKANTEVSHGDLLSEGRSLLFLGDSF